MLKAIEDLVLSTGIEQPGAIVVARFVAFFIAIFLAAAAFYFAKRVILRVATAIVTKSRTRWDDRLLEHRVLFWLAHLAPGIVLYLLIPVALEGAETLIAAAVVGAQIYMVVVGMLTFDSLLNAGLEIYDSFAISRQIPLKSFVQVAKIALYIVATIVVLAVVLGKSPIYLLGSMGVLASVLTLVFKDSILGFVAGIQLSANRMLAKGDWIEMPSYQADGDVLDISLTTVKVQNWDKTITTIPTYALITDSFKNWRGMSDTGGRRIKRSIFLDMSSIKLCSEALLARFAEIQHIASYLEEKGRELDAWNLEHRIDGSDRVNARRLTNVGTFRAYVRAYLENHPQIRQDLTLLVRQLRPTPEGLPIEIYCFTNDTRWAHYENIQADIFDHILAVVPEFDLRVFQNPGGTDLQALARQRTPGIEGSRI